MKTIRVTRYKCDFCGATRSTKRSIRNHESLCFNNAGRVPMPFELFPFPSKRFDYKDGDCAFDDAEFVWPRCNVTPDPCQGGRVDLDLREFVGWEPVISDFHSGKWDPWSDKYDRYCFAAGEWIKITKEEWLILAKIEPKLWRYFWEIDKESGLRYVDRIEVKEVVFFECSYCSLRHDSKQFVERHSGTCMKNPKRQPFEGELFPMPSEMQYTYLPSGTYKTEDFLYPKVVGYTGDYVRITERDIDYTLRPLVGWEPVGDDWNHLEPGFQRYVYVNDAWREISTEDWISAASDSSLTWGAGFKLEKKTRKDK